LRRARAHRDESSWPGFVDALTTLVLVFVFVLAVFMISQFLATQAISGRDDALAKLNQQVADLADLLALERRASADLRLSVASLTSELAEAKGARDDLAAKLNLAETAARERLAAIEALTKRQAEIDAELVRRAEALTKEKKLAAEAQAQVELLNKQIAELRAQLGRIETALKISERESAEQKAAIADLGKRLNLALAAKVEELDRYRSEFFGELSRILGRRSGIQVVGDRFVFQSEVLFASGSADISAEGRRQLEEIARVLLDISRSIPSTIQWLLRVDGHTDRVPIRTPQFPSNWELSHARAMSVVRVMMERGIPPDRLAATGFAEHHPVDARDDEIARRRNRRIELKLTQR